MVVTHNPNGEYGHRHHRWISNMVTSASNKVNLYYFDRYHLEADENKLLSPEEFELLKLKEEYLEVYESQKAIINNHRNSLMYENFISYYDWNTNTDLNGMIQ